MRKYKEFRYWKARNCKKGENNPVCKIGDSVVDYIIKNFIPHRKTAVQLAKKFGLSVGHVRSIIKGKYRNQGKLKRPILHGQTRLLNKDEIRLAIQLHNQDWSERELARKFNVSRGCIQYAIRRGAGVVERARLESEKSLTAFVGSNPTLSDQ